MCRVTWFSKFVVIMNAFSFVDPAVEDDGGQEETSSASTDALLITLNA